MDNPTSKFALDHWYKVMMAGGLLVFCLAGMGLLKEFPTAPTALMAAGVFFIGMGEWINHPLRTQIVPRSYTTPGAVLEGHPRSPTAAGWFFDALGLGLLAFGAFKLLA